MTETTDDGSITLCVDQLKRGDRDAAPLVWQRYFHRLVALARARPHAVPWRAADEEDVALSAFDSFFRRAERGQFPGLEDRDDLWQVLFVLTVRKAANLAKLQGRAKRGGGRCSSCPSWRGRARTGSSAPSRRPSWRRRWPRVVAGSWTASATTPCAG
jgi:hypothetical protein